MIRILARAKVNLGLRIKGLRPGGYHEVETVLQSITLHDEVHIERSNDTRSTIEWATGLDGDLPERPDIIERTIRLARELVPAVPAAKVRVLKRIPIGSGLGGASADAAAALLGLVALHGRALPAGLVDEIAVKAGVDVPFCLRGGTALGTGAGDQIRALPCAGTLWWVLGISETPLSTPDMYRRYDEMQEGHFEPTSTDSATRLKDLAGALAEGDLKGIAAAMFNDLEVPAFDLFPELSNLKAAMGQAGALGSVMTGSGSTIIGLCRDSSHARRVAAEAAKTFARVEVVASARTGNEMLSR